MMRQPIKGGDPFLWACVQVSGCFALAGLLICLIGWLTGALK